MHPIRILILAILFYILYRVIFGGKKTVVGQKKEEIGPNEDVLVEDPVCHTYVPQSTAIKTEKNGKMHYFCSQKCCDAFKEDHK